MPREGFGFIWKDVGESREAFKQGWDPLRFTCGSIIGYSVEAGLRVERRMRQAEAGAS